MGFRRRRWMLAEVCLAAVLTLLAAEKNPLTIAQAQNSPAIALTPVTDTIYHADGTPATGSVLISWPAFSTSAGRTIAAGSTSATIGAGGALGVSLVANAGSTPMGSYYTVVYHLDDGAVTRQYWVVPVSTVAVQVSTISSSVLPASVAMQTVSKAYVDTAIAAAVTGHPLDDATEPYVEKAGDTMTGSLILPGDPTAPLQASDKNYVDGQIAGVSAGLNGKVALLPQATQVIAQPQGTVLGVNDLNGTQYASQFANGAGNNGIANATASANCTAGCDVVAEQTYPQSEALLPATWKNQTHVDDRRGGANTESYLNPLPLQDYGENSAKAINVFSTQSAQSVLAATGSSEITSVGLTVTNEGLAGGTNVYPRLIQGSVPYFKTTYSAEYLNGLNYTLGQHVLVSQQQNCFAVGDCLMGGEFMVASGGFRDEADEGSHPFDRDFSEDTRVFEGTCAGGCTTGSTTVQIAPTANAQTQGEGRYLIDTNPGKVITTGMLVGGSNTGVRQPTANFSGTNFPVSVFLETAQTIPTQSNSINPGTVSFPIATSAVPAGFATNTAALPANSGVACVSDVAQADNRPLYFETAAYTVLDGTHLQMMLVRPHALGATVAVGGMCGYGLEQTIDTNNGIRQVFPVIGSPTSTSLLYAGGASAIVGTPNLTSAFLNVSLAVASIARTSGVVTVTTTVNPPDLNGLTLQVANVADSSYNGSFQVTSTGPNTLTYTNNGPNSSSSGGSLSLVTGGFALYPMAEVESVYNATTHAVDGQMALAANTVNWASGDTVEQPHYFQEKVSDDTDIITQFTPRPASLQSAGIVYDGNNGTGLIGWQINNSTPYSNYFGNGGTHLPPSVGMNLLGVWNHSMEMEAGESAVFDVHCNSHGCNNWNSTYDLFDMDSSTGTDRMRYQPKTSTLTYYLDGAAYNFAPQGFTANTINVTTLNAGTVNGLFQGSVAAGSLPLFGPSGTAHQVGAVPDPGASAGVTRFLREDGTWVTPASGSSLPPSAAPNTVLAGPASGTAGATSFRALTAADIPPLPYSAGQPLTPGAAADYNYAVNGTTLIDASGNGNNGTLCAGSNAPSPQPVGMAFPLQSCVNLPATLNNAQTIVFSLYINPANSATLTQVPVFLSNTVGFNHQFNIFFYANYPTGGFSNIDAAYAPAVYDLGPTTTAVGITSGYHVFALTRGAGTPGNCTSLDHLYIDGVEYASYGVQGCSGSEQTSGNLTIGSSVSGYMPGNVYRTIFYPGTLTAAQIAVDSNVIRNQDIARGVVTSAQPQPLAVPALNVAGDSITFGYSLTGPNLTPYSALLSLTNPPTTGVNNWGISGMTLYSIAGSEPNRVGPLCRTAAGPAVYTIFSGTNDFLLIAGATPNSVFNTLASIISEMKVAGCRVGVVTMISRQGSGTSNGGASFAVDKNAYNSLILSGARAAGADFIVDAAANPNLGADSAYANSTYFQSDGAHPTEVGQQLIANAFSNAYNYTFGHNKASPNVVSTATYQMLSGDGAVSLTGPGAQALTLPDCTGPSGAIYYLNNSTGVAKTVLGGVNQPINGLATAITVPANSSLALFDVPNPETVSGCHWEF